MISTSVGQKTLLVLLLLSVQGCASSIQLYSGPPKTPEKVVTIETSSSGGLLLTVDGEHGAFQTRGQGWFFPMSGTVEVEPGHHKLEVCPVWHNFFSDEATNVVSIEIDAPAGTAWEVKADGQCVVVADRGGKTFRACATETPPPSPTSGAAVLKLERGVFTAQGVQLLRVDGRWGDHHMFRYPDELKLAAGQHVLLVGFVDGGFVSNFPKQISHQFASGATYVLSGERNGDSWRPVIKAGP
jgi:hypothetical protein